jgi:Fe-S cluster assembly scaffold protein SufB
MDSEPKKAEIDEEAIWMEMEETEKQEIDKDDPVELAEDDEKNSSREVDDEVDRLEWEYDRIRMEEMEKDIIRQAVLMGYISRSEVDSDEYDLEDDEDEDGIEIWKISRNDEGCGKE